MLPQLMDTSSSTSPYFLAYKAAQVKLGDKGFLSRDITVRDLLLNRSDVHHVFPRNHLKKQGLQRGATIRSPTSSSRRARSTSRSVMLRPKKYFADLAEPMSWGSCEVRWHQGRRQTRGQISGRIAFRKECSTEKCRHTTSFWNSVVSSWRRKSRNGLQRYD